jgi:hypothetical protein
MLSAYLCRLKEWNYRRAEWLIACARFNVAVVMTMRIVVESGKVQTIRKDILLSAKGKKR